MAYGNGGDKLSAPGDVMYLPKGIAASFENQSTATRMPATQVEVERLTKASHHLHEMLGELESRLGDVLSPEPADAPTNKPDGPQSIVALARCIGLEADAIEHACGRVKLLMKRIEV